MDEGTFCFLNEGGRGRESLLTNRLLAAMFLPLAEPSERASLSEERDHV
jgi:hypothetical protein